MSELPKDLDDAIEQAKGAMRAAVEAGYTRLQVELVFPELKLMPIAEKFLPTLQEMGVQFKVYFPDAGAAALARREWGEPSFVVRSIGELKGQIEPDDELFFMVEPSAVEVKEVEKLCVTAGDRPFIMLNPSLEDISIVGIGSAARRLRERFVSQFDACYYLKPLEGCAIRRCYPEPWQVWLETESGDYQLISEEPRKPTNDDLDRILAPTDTDDQTAARPGKGLFSGLQEFLRALNQ